MFEVSAVTYLTRKKESSTKAIETAESQQKGTASSQPRNVPSRHARLQPSAGNILYQSDIQPCVAETTLSNVSKPANSKTRNRASTVRSKLTVNALRTHLQNTESAAGFDQATLISDNPMRALPFHCEDEYLPPSPPPGSLRGSWQPVTVPWSPRNHLLLHRASAALRDQ